MKILWSWLKDFLHTEAISPEQAAYLLTRAGSETLIHSPTPWTRHVNVVRIESCSPHPQADHLRICQIQTGQGLVQVVCGGVNARAGLTTLWAKPGCVLPGAKQALSVCALRGMESHGMLCSAQELALEDVLGTQDGIVELDDAWIVGQSLSEAWTRLFEQEDALLDIEVTPNRGYLMSHLGVARELASLTDLSWFKAPETTPMNFSGQDMDFEVDVTIAPQFFMARLTVNPSALTPALVRRRLSALDASLHFPAVDMTNIMSYGLGQPMHVFDAQSVQGRLVVRKSIEGEVFQALNDKVYTLPEGLIVIADDQGLLSLAGVMGGKRGACQPDSQEILLESAHFLPNLIARAGQKTLINSQARQRFERSVDPQMTGQSFTHALSWLKTHTGGSVQAMVSRGGISASKAISLSPSLVSSLGGIDLPEDLILKRLHRLWARVDRTDHPMVVHPASFRPLWTTPEETVEEILRLEGYEDVLPKKIPQKQGQIQQDNGWKMRRFLVSQGFYEVITWSLMDESEARSFFKGTQEAFETLKLLNPISKDLSTLRPSALPNLIHLAQTHEAKKVPFHPVFEIGPVFYGGNPGQQKTRLSGLIPVRAQPSWRKPKDWDFFDLKALCESLLWTLGLEATFEKSTDQAPYHPGQCAQILHDGKVVGHLGAFHPRHKWPFLTFEIDLDQLSVVSKIPRLKEPSEFQPVEKDLSFFLKGSSIGAFCHVLEKSAQPDLTGLRLMDVYHEEEEVSIMVRCTFQPQQATYTAKCIQALMEKVVVVAQNHGGTLRGQLV